jgi:hypothetical protein
MDRLAKRCRFLIASALTGLSKSLDTSVQRCGSRWSVDGDAGWLNPARKQFQIHDCETDGGDTDNPSVRLGTTTRRLISPFLKALRNFS